MPHCSTCATELTDSGVCPVCGSHEAILTCDRCGEHFADSDSCPACGAAVGYFPCDVHPQTTAQGRCAVCLNAMCRECVCGDGRALVCAEHDGVPIIQGWAQVYSTTREFDAQLLRDNLAADGLEARIFSQRDRAFPVGFGELSIVRLLVPAWCYQQASEIIRRHMDESGEVLFACPVCGEAYDSAAAQCEKCGNELSASQA